MNSYLHPDQDPWRSIPRRTSSANRVPQTGWEDLPVSMPFHSEAELAQAVLDRLAPHFHVDREVEGTHSSGRRLRIDAVLRPRDSGQWARPDLALGVEFKNVTRQDTNCFTRWAAQAVDYVQTDWDGYGRMVLFTCPGVLTTYRLTFRSDDTTVGFAEGLLGQLGVGELALRSRSGLTLLQQGRVIWREHGGVLNGRTWPLRVKTGSR